MEKFRIIVFVLFLGIVGILVYTLSKSWFIFDRGIKVKEEEPVPVKGKATVVKKTENHLDNAEIIWGKYLYYAIDLERRNGGYGPDEILSRARNLVFIHTQTGNVKKLFKKNVYIHDFFPGTFSRQKERRGFAEPKVEVLDIGQRFVILAVDEDTNEDGFLNDDDMKKVFIYEPASEHLVKALPENFYFENLFYNSGKNILAMVVRKHSRVSKIVTEKDEKLPEEDKLYLFFYNVVREKGKTVSSYP